MLDCDNPVRKRIPVPGEVVPFRVIAGTVGPSSRNQKNCTATVTAVPDLVETPDGEMEMYDFRRQDKAGNEINVQNMILSKTFPDPKNTLRPGMTAADLQDRSQSSTRIAIEWLQNLMAACDYSKELAGKTITPTPQAQAQNHNEYCSLPAEFTAPSGKIDICGELSRGDATTVAKILNALVGRKFLGRVTLRKDNLHEVSQIMHPDTKVGATAGLEEMAHRAEERIEKLRNAAQTDDDVLKEIGLEND